MGVQAIGHYLPLHRSTYFRATHDGRSLANTDKFATCLIRLPIFYSISNDEIDYIIKQVKQFFHIVEEPVAKAEQRLLSVVQRA